MGWTCLLQQTLVHYWTSVSLSGQDNAHDLGHIRRVLSNALHIQEKEGGLHEILEPAIWFHDLVNLPKNHPDRKKASSFSAREAKRLLSEIAYPKEWHDAIAHAIEAHSYSAAIAPMTLEAKILQDADRLDALGAIGIARTFAVSGQLNRSLFHPETPLPLDRPINDDLYALDHFYTKLFLLPEQMQTGTGRSMAVERVEFMKRFVGQLVKEAVV